MSRHDIRNGIGKTHTFRITKPWCVAARDVCSTAFKALGISAVWSNKQLVFGGDESATGIGATPAGPIPFRQHQDVMVSAAQATWAEYVLGSICGQTRLKVTRGIMDRSNYMRGKSRQGTPMPWKYRKDAKGGSVQDDLLSCVDKLSGQEREWAEKDPQIKKLRTDRSPGNRKGIVYTSERQRKTAKKAKKTHRTRKASTARGAHRGAHRR